MPSKTPITNIRMEPGLKEKITYIAKDNNRSMNQEIIFLIKKHVEDESEHGEIQIPEKE